MTRAVVAMGANLGDRATTIADAMTARFSHTWRCGICGHAITCTQEMVDHAQTHADDATAVVR